MREDARNLLERLSRKEFRYQEFADQFADMDLWPLFEALLKDERVVGARPSSLPETEVHIRERRPGTDRGQEERRAIGGSGLFDRYAPPPASGTSTGGKIVNLRQFLGKLSDKN